MEKLLQDVKQFIKLNLEQINTVEELLMLAILAMMAIVIARGVAEVLVSTMKFVLREIGKLFHRMIGR